MAGITTEKAKPISDHEPGKPRFWFNFHGIGQPGHSLSPSEERVWITESCFHDLLDFLKTQDNIGLTFDDANESDYQIALPALQAWGLRARFFLVADRIDRPDYLTRAQVLALVAAGMKIGNHGMRHRPWARLSADDLNEELVTSRDAIEQIIGAKVEEAACPFGSYNRRVIRALQQAGYHRAYTSDCGLADSDGFLQARNSIYRTDDLQTVQATISMRPRLGRRWWRACRLIVKRWR